MLRFVCTPAILAIAALGLTACDEQQVLYTYQSETAIPPVPEGVETAIITAPAMGAASRASSDLPPAVRVQWTQQHSEQVTSATFQGLTVELPARYQLSDRQMPMRIGTWMIPPPDATIEPGELVVYYFGAGQGGGVEENVRRWLGQFRTPPGVETALIRYQQGQLGSLTINRSTMEGTWAPPAMGPGAPAQPARPDYAMDALIVEGGPEGTLFFRFTGPAVLIQREDANIRAIAASVKAE